MITSVFTQWETDEGLWIWSSDIKLVRDDQVMSPDGKIYRVVCALQTNPRMMKYYVKENNQTMRR